MDEQEKTPPPGVIVASNGAWKDARTGRFMAGGKLTTAITEENANDYHRMRQEKKVLGLLAADNALAALASTPVKAWEKVITRMYNLTDDEKSSVAAVQAAKFIGDASGFLASGNARGDADPVPASGARLELGPDALNTLLDYISEHRQAEDSPQPGATAMAAGGRAGETEEE